MAARALQSEPRTGRSRQPAALRVLEGGKPAVSPSPPDEQAELDALLGRCLAGEREAFDELVLRVFRRGGFLY